MKNILLGGVCLGLSFFLPKPGFDKEAFLQDNFRVAATQLKAQLIDAEKHPQLFPRTTDSSGYMKGTDMYDWTSGFFSGSLWYAYEFTQDKALENAAIQWTEKLAPLQYYTQHHDLGFMMNCSYGNAYRLTGKKEYSNILIQSARSLATRFNPKVGCIKSWNVFRSWNDGRQYAFPVIIDNMMNLELLFFASKASGDPSFREIAVKHAETTLKNHFRPDFSSYHVVCYDSVTGKVLGAETAQGYADNSTWARGQAWAVYGYTVVYRETMDKRFLQAAEKMADWFINNPRQNADLVPFWDFNAQQQGYVPGARSYANSYTNMPRDVSAAAVTASALLELGGYSADGKRYRDAAIKILESLGGSGYRAMPGTNGNFILQHSVGSIPHRVEIDVPLVYADYYFLEALNRLSKLDKIR